MGNAQTRDRPPTTVLTVVLVGGRTEQHEGPMLVKELMNRHPCHRVVKPDCFRCCPVVVLRPEEVLMPGDRFFLVPCCTVYKRFLRTVGVLAWTSAGQSPTSSGHSKLYQTGAVPVSKKGLAGGSPATRSPTGRAPLALKKSSPARSPQARKEKVSRYYARRRPSTNHKDYARRTSLLSQMRKHDGSSTKVVQENESFELADSTELESSQSADFGERSTLEPSVLVTRLAALLDMPDPEDESFKTPIMRSPEQAEDSFVSAETSPFQEPESSSEAVDSEDSEEQGEKSSSEPSLLIAPTLSDGCASIVSTGTDSRGDDSKRSLRASGDAMELNRGRHLGQQPPSQAREKQLVSQQEPDRSLIMKGKPPPQQQGSRTEIAGLKELQDFYRGSDNDKFLVKPLKNGLFKPTAHRHQEGDQVMPSAIQPKPRTLDHQQNMSCVKQQKQRQRKLIDHLCFTSPQLLLSPPNASAAAGNVARENEPRAVQPGLKLKDILELDLSPLQDEKNCYQRTAMMVKNMPLPRFEQLPNTHESIRTKASAGQDLEQFQLNNGFNTQCDPTVLRSKLVNQMLSRTPREDAFLIVPPGGPFRRRRFRRRALYTSVNWKPLKPVIETSP